MTDMSDFTINQKLYSAKKLRQIIDGKGIDIMPISLFDAAARDSSYHIVEFESSGLDYVIYTHFDHRSNAVILGADVIKRLKEKCIAHVPSVYVSVDQLMQAAYTFKEFYDIMAAQRAEAKKLITGKS